MAKYAAVGSDGMRLVVWGLGDTVAEAHEDAARWLSEASTGPGTTLEIHEITEAQAALIEDGEIVWPHEAE